MYKVNYLKNNFDMERVICFVLLFLVYYQSSCYAQEKSLVYFLNQGLTHSPVLKDIKNQINSNLVDSLFIKANNKPQVSFNSSLYYAPLINGVGYNDAITNINNITSVVSVSQRILNNYTVESQYSKIGIQKQALQFSAKLSENDLKKTITMQYLTTCSVSNELSFNKNLFASLKNEETILQQLVEKGLYKQVDYLSFQVEIQGEELLLKDLQIQYQKEFFTLNILCGLQDTTYEELLPPDIKKLSATIYVNSPFFMRFAIDSLRIQNEKSLIDRNYKPSITGTFDGGLVNIVPNDLKRNFGFSLGLSITLPIYDGNQRELNYQKLEISEDTRKSYADYFKIQYDQQLQQLNDELRKTQEALILAKQQLNLVESIIKQNRTLLNIGNITITDFAIALKNYISVKRNVNQYQIKILQSINEINYWNQ